MLRRTRGVLAVSVILSTMVAVVTSGADVAHAGPYPIRYATDADNLADVTPDGRWAVAQTVAPQRTMRVDLATGATVTLPYGLTVGGLPTSPGRISDDGSTYWWHDGSVLRQTVVGAGGSTSYGNPFDGRLLEGQLWTWSGGITDVAGPSVILRASTGTFGNADFRFDPASGALERAIVPQRTRPPEHDDGLSYSAFSPDAQWVTFWSDSPDVIPGLTGTIPRLFRRSVPSGQTHLVGAFVPNTVDVFVGNGGLLVLAIRVVDVQLYTWSQPGTEVQLVSVGLNGEAPSGPLTPFSLVNTIHISDDSTRVTFTSLANNLDGERGGTSSRLYQLTLPPPYPNASAVVQPSETFCVPAVGAAPGDFVGVNVTPVFAASPGFGVIHSSDDPAGSTSNVNFGPGTVDPNVAFAKVGADGRICFTNSVHGPVHVIIDEMIVADATAFRSPTATGSARLADTRVGLGGAIVAASETRCLPAVGAVAGEFVGVNVLPVEAATPGYGTIHPGGTTAGSSSTANFGAGTFDPNFAFTEVGADGTICFTNSVHGPVHVIIDELIVGAETAMARPTPGPASDRPVDTRFAVGAGRLASGARVCFAVPGGAAGDFAGVNILPVFADGPGFGTLHSSADAPGSTSNVNFSTGTFDPNFAIASFGPDGQVCFTNGAAGAVDVIIDSQVIAASAVFAEPTADGSVRLVDTRIARA